MADFFSTPIGTFVIILAQCLAVLGFVMISLLFLVYGDRKIWAAVQMRRGPNVVGVFGILQSLPYRFASIAGALRREMIVWPSNVDRQRPLWADK